MRCFPRACQMIIIVLNIIEFKEKNDLKNYMRRSQGGSIGIGLYQDLHVKFCNKAKHNSILDIKYFWTKMIISQV